MEISKIRLQGRNAIDLPLLGATPASPFYVRSVDGFGPPEIKLTIAELPGQEPIVQQSEPGSRELIINVGMNPQFPGPWSGGGAAQTPGSLRESLYTLLTGYETPTLVTVYDAAEAPFAEVRGYVKRIEPTIFEQDTAAQIVITCPSPYFYGVTEPGLPRIIDYNGINYPDGWRFYYTPVGTAPAPMIVQATVLASNGTVMFSSNIARSTTVLSRANAPGNVVVLNSNPHQRNVTVDGVTVLGNVSHLGTVDWPEVLPGMDNSMLVSGARLDSIVYTPRYWGF